MVTSCGTVNSRPERASTRGKRLSAFILNDKLLKVQLTGGHLMAFGGGFHRLVKRRRAAGIHVGSGLEVVRTGAQVETAAER